MRIALSLVMIASFGCKRDDAPTCDSVVRSIVPVLLPARADVTKSILDERRGNLSGILAQRCRDDRWSSIALACIAKATTEVDFRTCAQNHTARESEQKIERVLAIAELRMPPVPPAPPAVEMPDLEPSDIPECEEYRKAVKELASCDKLPAATRVQIAKAWNETVGAWDKLPTDARAAAVIGCKAATDATKQAIAACR